MASITVRNIDENLKHRLRVRAAEHGRSMEEEVRAILRCAIGAEASGKDLAQRIHERFARLGGLELDLLGREPVRDPPTFDESSDT